MTDAEFWGTLAELAFLGLIFWGAFAIIYVTATLYHERNDR